MFMNFCIRILCFFICIMSLFLVSRGCKSYTGLKTSVNKSLDINNLSQYIDKDYAPTKISDEIENIEDNLPQIIPNKTIEEIEFINLKIIERIISVVEEKVNPATYTLICSDISPYGQQNKHLNMSNTNTSKTSHLARNENFMKINSTVKDSRLENKKFEHTNSVSSNLEIISSINNLAFNKTETLSVQRKNKGISDIKSVNITHHIVNPTAHAPEFFYVTPRVSDLHTTNTMIKDLPTGQFNNQDSSVMIKKCINQTYACSAYKENYKPHFLIRETTDLNLNGDIHFPMLQMYNYSPLFHNYRLATILFRKQDDDDISKISDSYNKPYSSKKSECSNYDSLLDHYLKYVFNIEEKFLNMDDTTSDRIKYNHTIIFYNIVRLFLSHSFEDPRIDFIVFNILIPFRNKAFCLSNHVEKYEYCKSCLGITDLFECCSIQIYDEEHKNRGEVYIKKAIKALNIELSNYVMSQDSSILQSAINCHYNNYALNLCANFYTKYSRTNPLN